MNHQLSTILSSHLRYVTTSGLMDGKTFFRELRRRNVHKVAIVYAVLAWLLFEAVSVFLFGFEGRTQLLTALLVVLVAGFLMALFISWAFEATPEGMKRTENVPADAVLPTWSRRKFTLFIIVVAALAASLLAFDVVRNRQNPTPAPRVATP
jgi:adenylate cyclase